jgi:hypothetical protein
MGDNRFSLHQIRWAYWVVRQNAVRIQHVTTGNDHSFHHDTIRYLSNVIIWIGNSFLALVPFYDMIEKKLNGAGSIAFETDGSVAIRVGDSQSGGAVAIHPGNLTDAEFLMRYLHVPSIPNPNNAIVMSLPGPLPSDSQFLQCLKDPKAARRNDDCKGGQFRSHSVFWQSETLSKWRKEMNLPPRLGELQMWWVECLILRYHSQLIACRANRLHIFGDDMEETKRISAANAIAAGLPVSTGNYKVDYFTAFVLVTV